MLVSFVGTCLLHPSHGGVVGMSVCCRERERERDCELIHYVLFIMVSCDLCFSFSIQLLFRVFEYVLISLFIYSLLNSKYVYMYM